MAGTGDMLDDFVALQQAHVTLHHEYDEAIAELKRHHKTFIEAGACVNYLDLLIQTLAEESTDLVQVVARLRAVLQVT